MPDSVRPGNSRADHGRDFHDHAQRDRHHRLARITARRGVTFDGRLGPQRVEVHAHDAADRVDRADALAAAAKRSSARIFDVRDVRRHLGPDRFLGRAP